MMMRQNCQKGLVQSMIILSRFANKHDEVGSAQTRLRLIDCKVQLASFSDEFVVQKKFKMLKVFTVAVVFKTGFNNLVQVIETLI